VPLRNTRFLQLCWGNLLWRRCHRCCLLSATATWARACMRKTSPHAVTTRAAVCVLC
jgi:hypothetical protein